MTARTGNVNQAAHSGRRRTAVAERPGRARRGVAFAMVMIAVLIVGLFSVGLVRRVVSHRRQAVRLQRSVQTFWLLQSGISRARGRLAADPQYRGERWQLPAEALGGLSEAEVIVRVKPASVAGGGGWQIDVTARYPVELPRRIEKRQTVHVAAKNEP